MSFRNFTEDCYLSEVPQEPVDFHVFTSRWEDHNAVVRRAHVSSSTHRSSITLTLINMKGNRNETEDGRAPVSRQAAIEYSNMDSSSEVLPAPLRVLDAVRGTFEPKTTEPANVWTMRGEMFEQQQAAIRPPEAVTNTQRKVPHETACSSIWDIPAEMFLQEAAAVSIPVSTPAPGQMHDTQAKSELQAEPDNGWQKQRKRRNKKRQQKPNEKKSVKPQTSQTHVAKEQSKKTQHAASEAQQEFIPTKMMVWDHIKGKFGQKKAAAFTSVKPKAWSNIPIETLPQKQNAPVGHPAFAPMESIWDIPPNTLVQVAAAVSIPVSTPATGQTPITQATSELQSKPGNGWQKQTKRRNKKRQQKPEPEVTQEKANTHKSHEENSQAPSKAPQEFIPAKKTVWDHIKGKFGQKPKAWSNILIETGPQKQDTPVSNPGPAPMESIWDIPSQMLVQEAAAVSIPAPAPMKRREQKCQEQNSVNPQGTYERPRPATGPRSNTAFRIGFNLNSEEWPDLRTKNKQNGKKPSHIC